MSTCDDVIRCGKMHSLSLAGSYRNLAILLMMYLMNTHRNASYNSKFFWCGKAASTKVNNTNPHRAISFPMSAHQNAPFWAQKLANFLWSGLAPPRPYLRRGGDTLPHPSLRHLRRFDTRALGARFGAPTSTTSRRLWTHRSLHEREFNRRWRNAEKRKHSDIIYRQW